MNKADWFDYNNKIYGILASNERRIFTGIDGEEGKPVEFDYKVE